MSENSIIKKRRQRRLLLIAAAVSGALLGTMAASTAAWLSTKDAITNVLNGSSMNAALEEPIWITTGMDKAQAYLPGAEIEKDPQVLNTGNADIYVRMKVKIVDKDGNEVDYATVRAENVLKSLYYKVSDGVYEPLITAAPEPYTTLPTLPAVRGCNINGKIYYSANPNFCLASDGYFYYIKTSDANEDVPELETLTRLEGDTPQRTSPLFDLVKIAHRQSDYAGSFSDSYELDVTGEAVSTAVLLGVEHNWTNMQAAFN